MRHAPKARFDRIELARSGLEEAHRRGSTVAVERAMQMVGEVERLPPVVDPTTRQMSAWTETDWNWHIRKALRSQGFRVLHIRETNETGVADLLVYRKIRVTGISPAEFTDLQTIAAWLELKVDNSKSTSNIRPAQREFMREHWSESQNAMFVMFDHKAGKLAVHQGDLKGRVKMLPAYPYTTRWQEVFTHFKNR